MIKDKILFGLTILWTLAISIVATILLSIPLFSSTIHWENLTEVSGFSHAVLMKNYRVLMEYLLNPFRSHLKMPNFPDSAGALQHFWEVKMLFLFVVALAIILIPAVYKFVKEGIAITFRRGLILAMIVPIILALMAWLFGFDAFFIAFHKILFRDNTWLFDPATDPIINVLTDNFFMYTFIIAGLLYEGILALIFWSPKWRKKK